MASSLSIPLNPSLNLKSPLSLFSIFFSFVFLSSIPSSISTLSSQAPEFEPLYDIHCNHFLPKSPLTGIVLESSNIGQTLPFTTGYFSSGDSASAGGDSSTIYPNSAKFETGRKIHATELQGIYKLEGVLRFTPPFDFNTNRANRGLREIRYRGPRIPIRRRWSIGFRLNGFWSESSGKLCMVGSSYRLGNLKSFNAVLKLSYSNSVNITVVDSFVSGSLESLDSEGSLNHFSPVSILGVPDHSHNYAYTLINNVKESDFFGGYNDSSVVSLSPPSYSEGGLCSMLVRHKSVLRLEYGSNCDNVSCNPSGLSVGSLPDSLLYNAVECNGKNRGRMLLSFVNSNYSGSAFPFDPKTTIVAEGAWDERRNQLYAVGCRILNSTESLGNSSVGDCSIKLSLRFPAVFSLRNRNVIEGQIWSVKNVNDSGYFEKIVFGSHRIGFQSYLPGLRYEYTVVDRVNKLCTVKERVKSMRKGRMYPDGYSPDLRFGLVVTNRRGETANGFSSPLFVGNQLYEHNSFVTVPAVHVNGSTVLNISYKMLLTRHFRLGSNISLARPELSAEGTYDAETGMLCMIGCWVVESNTKRSMRNESVDCEILVKVQFPAVNGKGFDKVKGTIESMREKNDPLYFEVLEFSSNSILATQAEESIWRMDFEITMVLISNTCSCLFLAMQLFYGKRHPEALPYISFTMVVLLMLGHMIPLVLNFEALFVGNHARQNVFLGSSGWLAVNEVTVRVVTMVAFLLELRLLQQTLFSRSHGDGTLNGLWVSERKSVYILLPLYICGGLVAWFVRQSKTSHQRPIRLPGRMRMRMKYPNPYQTVSISLWDVVRSYSGLVLDGFLLPQVFLNFFSNSRENALAAPFYIGTTIIRLVPHAYDLYRAHSYARYLDLSYIYANHRKDFYSTFWNVVIPFGGLFLAALVYLQQRFGGRCFLPKKLRESSGYEKLAVTNGHELQELTSL